MAIYANSVTAVGVSKGKVPDGAVDVQAICSTNSASEGTTVTIRASRLVSDTWTYLDRKDIPTTLSSSLGDQVVPATLTLTEGYATFDAVATNGAVPTEPVVSNVLVT